LDTFLRTNFTQYGFFGIWKFDNFFKKVRNGKNLGFLEVFIGIILGAMEFSINLTYYLMEKRQLF
jgi:hypothetical protein